MGDEAGRVIDVWHGRPVLNVQCIRRHDMGDMKSGNWALPSAASVASEIRESILGDAQNMGTVFGT
jgi:hypothetical protein